MGQSDRRCVVVGVIYDKQRGSLLPYNDRWKRYAFVMKRVEEGKASARVALEALKGDLRLRFPDASATAVDRVGVYGQSERTGEEFYYDCTVYLFDLGPSQGGAASAGEARYFTYQQLRDSADVSWNTKKIAEALVKEREVVAAVVARRGPAGVECLLINSRPKQYFLPSTRRKTDVRPEEVARAAMEQDTGYEGPVQASWVGEQEFMQISHRFGEHETRFRFHVCRVDLPGGDLNDQQGTLAEALRQKEGSQREAEADVLAAGYYRWCPLDQLRTLPDASPTLQQLAALIVKAAE